MRQKSVVSAQKLGRPAGNACRQGGEAVRYLKQHTKQGLGYVVGRGQNVTLQQGSFC